MFVTCSIELLVPIEPVQARVHRPSSRESLLNWDIPVCCVWFDYYYYYILLLMCCLWLWLLIMFEFMRNVSFCYLIVCKYESVLLLYVVVNKYLELKLIICSCNTTCSTHHFTQYYHTPPCGHTHARSAKMYVSEW